MLEARLCLALCCSARVLRLVREFHGEVCVDMFEAHIFFVQLARCHQVRGDMLEAHFG